MAFYSKGYKLRNKLDTQLPKDIAQVLKVT